MQISYLRRLLQSVRLFWFVHHVTNTVKEMSQYRFLCVRAQE